MSVCEAFRAGLIPPRDVPFGTPARELAVTYWPVDPGGFRSATAIVAFLEEFEPQVLSLIQLP